MVSMMRTLGSPSPATRSRVSSSDFPTLTTTSSHRPRIDRMAGTIGKSSVTAFRTMVNPEITSGAELHVVQPAVPPTRRVQGGVGYPPHDPPLAEHPDQVRVPQ